MRPDPLQARDVELMQIVEVPKPDAVRCQHNGCGRQVYKRIHILRIGDEFSCVGSDCFNRFYQHSEMMKSKFSVGGGDGVALTEAQARLLEENTLKLLDEVRAQYADTERVEEPARPMPVDDVGLRQYALEEARRILKEEHPGVNLDLPGNSGWVTLRAKKIFRELQRERNRLK